MNVSYASCTLFAALVGFPGSRCSYAGDAQPTPYRAKLHAAQSTFPLGGPVPLVFDFCNDSRQSTFLQMDHLGFPDGMEVILVPPDGEETEVHSSNQFDRFTDNAGPPIPAGAQNLFVMPANTCVRLSYELNRLFPLSRSGQYTVRLRMHGADLSQFDFRIVRLNIVEDINVDGYVEHPPALSPVVLNARSLRCKLQNATSADKSSDHQFIIVKDKHIGEKQEDGQEFFLRVPQGTRIAAHAIDVRWRLWMLIESGEKTALVIGNLQDGTVRIAIEWTSEKILFGTTRAQTQVKGMVVVAGKANEPMLSTLSETLSSRGRSIDLSGARKVFGTEKEE